MEDKVPETLQIEEYAQESQSRFFALPSWFKY